MHSTALATLSAVHVNWPLAAAPQRTPQMRGTQVTGFISCSRIFHLSSVSDAPFMPSSCRAPPSFCSLLLPAARTAGEGVRVSETRASSAATARCSRRDARRAHHRTCLSDCVLRAARARGAQAAAARPQAGECCALLLRHCRSPATAGGTTVDTAQRPPGGLPWLACWRTRKRNARGGTSGLACVSARPAQTDRAQRRSSGAVHFPCGPHPCQLHRFFLDLGAAASSSSPKRGALRLWERAAPSTSGGGSMLLAGGGAMLGREAAEGGAAAPKVGGYTDACRQRGESQRAPPHALSTRCTRLWGGHAAEWQEGLPASVPSHARHHRRRGGGLLALARQLGAQLLIRWERQVSGDEERGAMSKHLQDAPLVAAPPPCAARTRPGTPPGSPSAAPARRALPWPGRCGG